MVPVTQLNRGFTYTVRYRESPRSHLMELTGVFLGKNVYGATFDLRPRAEPKTLVSESIVEAFYGGELPAMLPRIVWQL